jgi:pimeloyl-ACP methyl ester carboxylesterase
MNRVNSKDGTAIAFDRFGRGPAVILVGGAFSYRSFPKMIELAQLLSDRFTVLNYDRRGRGDSGDTGPYAVEREIEDLEALIAAAGGSASVWGWSSGGVLALRAAAAGVGIERVAVYETPFMVDTTGHLPPPDFAARLEALLQRDKRSTAVRHYLTEGMGVPGPIVALMRLTPFWKKLKAVAHTLPYDWAVMGDTMSGRPLAREEWGRIEQPVLVVSGEKSPVELRKAARALAEVLPNARHEVLAGQSHNPRMKKVAPGVASFFDTAMTRGGHGDERRDPSRGARQPTPGEEGSVPGRGA